MIRRRVLIPTHLFAYGLLFAGSEAWFDSASTLASAILASGLITASVTDMRRHIIPDFSSLGLVLAGLAATWWFWPEMVAWHALAALVWFALLAGLSEAYFRLYDRDGFGLGDAKLMAASAAWLGAVPTISVLLYASIAGIAALLIITRFRIEKRSVRTGLAFGPYIALSIWIVWLYGVTLSGL